MEQIATNILNEAAPVLAEFVVSAVVIGIGALYSRVARTKLDDSARDRLHSALMTGAKVAISRDLSDSEKIEQIIEYTQASVPDALKRLKPGIGTLQKLALSKLEDALK